MEPTPAPPDVNDPAAFPDPAPPKTDDPPLPNSPVAVKLVYNLENVIIADA